MCDRVVVALTETLYDPCPYALSQFQACPAAPWKPIARGGFDINAVH
ncbi:MULTISPECIES: hypothetical protein [unclassified Caulobacter]|nr:MULTISPECIES: hypothetical protein [unclassified Caulobacter]